MNRFLTILLAACLMLVVGCSAASVARSAGFWAGKQIYKQLKKEHDEREQREHAPRDVDHGESSSRSTWSSPDQPGCTPLHAV